MAKTTVGFSRRRVSLRLNTILMQRILILLLAALCVASCGRRRNASPQQTETTASRPRVFLPAIAPSGLSPEEQRDYLRWHYWDRFDFADTLFVSLADTVQMVEAYARYIALISDRPADSAPMDSLMHRPRRRSRCSTISRCLPIRCCTTPTRPCATTNSTSPCFGRSSPALLRRIRAHCPAVRPEHGHAEPSRQPANDFAIRSLRGLRERFTA